MRRGVGHQFVQALTLVEVMVVLCVTSMVFLFLFNLMRHVGTGMTRIQRQLPLHRDLLIAKQSIEKDLLSAPRSSIGNAAPNPGFEEVPTRVSTFTPTTDGFWACPPTPPRRTGGGKYMYGFVSAKPEYVLNGHYSMNMNMLNMNGNNCYAYSSTFKLLDNTNYLFGGWIKKNIPNNRWARIQLFGDVNPWPMTSLGLLSTDRSTWTFVVATMTTGVGITYRIQAGAADGDTARMSLSFDDIVMTPMAVDLFPGDLPFEFQRVRTSPPELGRRERVRYRLVASGKSGQLVRERWDGSVWEELKSLNNIRRLRLAWDFSRGVAGGGFPPPAQWPSYFAEGLNFPVSVTIEVGDVGAPNDKSLSLSFLVYSGVP